MQFNELAFRDTVRERYPRIPEETLNRIVLREALRPQNARLAVASYVPLAIASVLGYIRHKLTPYDALLCRNYTRERARDKIRPLMYQYAEAWS